MTTNLLADASHPVRTTDHARGAAFDLAIHATRVDGAHTTYLDEGAGSVVLLLHGAPVTSLGFARVVHELRATHRVIAPDLPGFGGSAQPAAFGGTLDEYARFVVGFVRALGLMDVVMFVNDASGCIGLAAATQLEPGVVRGLVVADTVPIPLTGAARLVQLLLRHVITSRPARWLNRRLNLLAWMVATMAPLLRPFSRVERVALTREFDTVEKRERILDLFAHMAEDTVFMQTTAERARARLTEVPALLLFGQLDPMRLIGGVTRFRRMFPRHHVAIVPWEEHFPILASGARVGRIVRAWMDDLPDRADSSAGAHPS